MMLKNLAVFKYRQPLWLLNLGLVIGICLIVVRYSSIHGAMWKFLDGVQRRDLRLMLDGFSQFFLDIFIPFLVLSNAINEFLFRKREKRSIQAANRE